MYSSGSIVYFGENEMLTFSFLYQSKTRTLREINLFMLFFSTGIDAKVGVYPLCHSTITQSSHKMKYDGFTMNLCTTVNVMYKIHMALFELLMPFRSGKAILSLYESFLCKG